MQEFLFKKVPDAGVKVGIYNKERIKAFGKALFGLLKTDLGDLRDGLKEAEATIQDGKEKVVFLRNALFDKNLKEFVARGVPEADLMTGKANLKDFFPTDPTVKSVISEAIGWWKEIMQNAPKGFQLAPTRQGFAANLDYGNSVVTPEPELEANQKDLIVEYYRSILHPKK